MSIPRFLPPMTGLDADANVQPRHPADAAAWIWHPWRVTGETAFLRFSIEVFLMETETIRVHVTADQRYIFSVDGVEVGRGPDRGVVERWPVASHELALSAGRHRFEALVWWIADGSLTGLRADASAGGDALRSRPPVAQTTWRGGFLFAGDGAMAPRLNSGQAPWRVDDLTDAVRLVQPVFPVYHDIGPEFQIDGGRWSLVRSGETAVVVAGHVRGNPHGVQRPGWRLAPASLPEQEYTRMNRGRVRAFAGSWKTGQLKETTDAGVNDWSLLLRGEGSVVVPPDSERTLLWDFEDYVCGYVRLIASGAGAQVRVDWAEALHEAISCECVAGGTRKGDRAAIDGKVFCGFGDEFAVGAHEVEFPAFWWRSGRFLQVRLRTGAQSLTIRSLAIISTGYPLGDAARVATNDEALNELAAICERTTRACAHEIWTDCPYYEQMAYVGDSRLAALVNYAVFSDDRLSRRMLELFDDSRRGTGLVAMRVPGTWTQVSVTYALLWVLMVRDFAWWRDDASFVRARLRGVRALNDEIASLAGENGLLGVLPGWSFVDWVPEWTNGCGPGVREGDSCLVNLHWLLALRAQTELEKHFGEPELAALTKRRADRIAAAIVERYWSAGHGLLADTGQQVDFSEHAQALGLSAELPLALSRERWVENWLNAPTLTRATVYFSFYVMEALRAAGRGDELLKRADMWRDLPLRGLLTVPEAPEPTRSDCHGWGAHLRWHFAASVAGVRPAAPGFARIEVRPLLGPLTSIDVVVRHPRGNIECVLRRDGQRLQGRLVLPEGICGELHWNEKTRRLSAGENEIDES
ncbi:alpha-L-rhamnosidase C-terminal domain-containing protein [Nibricoccus aquaticus]|nr:alpha-L-rhamnosidase C-terminal domain-containing protein [Nibricoccus aquaticus]